MMQLTLEVVSPGADGGMVKTLTRSEICPCSPPVIAPPPLGQPAYLINLSGNRDSGEVKLARASLSGAALWPLQYLIVSYVLSS